MRLWTGLVVGLLLAAPWPGAAQVLGTGVTPVVEVGANLTQNGITAIQSAITAAQTTLIQANQIIDMTPVRSLTAAGGIVEDMELLCDIIKQGEALNTDWESLQRQVNTLLALQTAPRTRSALDQRMAELRKMKQDARLFALRTQTLIKTLIKTGDHMKALFTDVEKLLGNLAGQQRLAEVQQLQNKTLATLVAQTTAWQRMDTMDKMTDELVVESVARIESSRMEGWPRW